MNRFRSQERSSKQFHCLQESPRLPIKSRRKKQRTQPLKKERLSEKARSAERHRQGLPVASRLWSRLHELGLSHAQRRCLLWVISGRQGVD